MPQIQLPIFPDGSNAITNELAFQSKDDTVYYFNGHLPVFSHPVDDIASFRFFTSQLIANGNASQGQIARAFGVPLVAVKRASKILRIRGAEGFFVPPPKRRGHRLTPEILTEAQAMLDEGFDVPAISEALGVLCSTLHKAIAAGRLKKRL